MHLFLLLMLLMLSPLIAKELFTEETIVQYLTEKNPFIYDAVGEKYIYKAKEEYALGDFDTKISGKLDTKRYPASEADFLDVTAQKPLENGLEFIVGFRQAEGVQEYNNIKTSEQGEFRIGMSVPIFELLEDTNLRKFNKQSASLNTIQFNAQSQDNLRILYFNIRSLYNNFLYYKSVLELEKQLYDKADKRKYYVEKRVQVGNLPKVALLEIEQQIINRKQRILSAENYYTKVLENFVQYLNLSKEDFLSKYTFVDILELEKKYIKIDKAIDIALANRTDLEVLAYEKKKLGLEMKQAKLLQYPKLNVGVYGVYDLKYNDGVKVMFDMEFPVEQRKYKGKYNQIQRGIENIENKKEKKIITIKTKLINIINSLDIIKKNIQNVQNEIALVEELENVEYKKYKVGASNLFLLNQREVYSLEIKKKFLQYTLEYLLLAQEAQTEMGKI
ncbi:MAG: TolC-like outermembrane protein [uncultured Sulfurovum sp.]|uniref:TolC-like outermembrane protein n=1 Tax=uncultured Sulfurovum sp. TaxID=269237 RepID=A0A6S6T0H1_9BACT|nr:MAG: TolC-like outermembrane protein [uncultured Sulfurovum sp.]